MSGAAIEVAPATITDIPATTVGPSTVPDGNDPLGGFRYVPVECDRPRFTVTNLILRRAVPPGFERRTGRFVERLGGGCDPRSAGACHAHLMNTLLVTYDLKGPETS